MTKRNSVKRWNPILGEWVIMAPATGIRPWSGTVVPPAKNDLPGFDPECYLCPGVKRSGGKVNPDYDDVFIFDNDFPSFSMDAGEFEQSGAGIVQTPALGICRVVCFSPKHNITLPEMSEDEVLTVFQALNNQFDELSAIPEINNVMIFENRGMSIGVSNPHPHGQIYSTDFLPRIPATRYAHSLMYMKEHNSCLFCKILDDELTDPCRIITRNDHFVAFVPYFARLTYEAYIMPVRHVPFITELNGEELRALAEIHHEMLVRYDNLFQMPFPNITVFQNAPCSHDIDPQPYHFHIEFLPPLRNRDKLKYMAGFESGGGNIVNPSLPEDSAETLRSLSTIHYSKRSL